MRHFKYFFFFLLFIVLLSGCTNGEKNPSNTKLTIEPYELSDKEKLLISKTNVEHIEFF